LCAFADADQQAKQPSRTTTINHMNIDRIHDADADADATSVASLQEKERESVTATPTSTKGYEHGNGVGDASSNINVRRSTPPNYRNPMMSQGRTSNGGMSASSYDNPSSFDPLHPNRRLNGVTALVTQVDAPLWLPPARKYLTLVNAADSLHYLVNVCCTPYHSSPIGAYVDSSHFMLMNDMCAGDKCVSRHTRYLWYAFVIGHWKS
jgi:hypothetical protein